MGVLPRKKSKSGTELENYSILIAGPKKVGKTWLASFMDGILFLGLEPACKGRPMYIDRPSSWRGIKKVITGLEEEEHDYNVVCTDTIERAYQMCCDYIVKKLGIPQMGTLASGKGDFGVSYAEVKKEMMEQYMRIERMGMTVVFLSHIRTRDLTTVDGYEYQKVMPAVPQTGVDFLESFTDMNFMLDYVRIDGKKARVILTEGDEHYFAGCGGNGDFPPILPLIRDKRDRFWKGGEYEGVVYENGWELLQKAFHGEVPGIDPDRVSTAFESKAVSNARLDALSEEKEVSGKRLKRRKGKKSPKRAKK